ARQAKLSMGIIRSIGMVIHDGHLYFSDHDNNRMRRIDLTTGIIETVLGSGAGGSHAVGHPTGLAFRDAFLYWAQLDGSLLRRVSLDTNVVEIVAGDGLSSYYGDGGPAAEAQLSSPQGLVIDGSGVIFVADGSH